MMAEPPEGGEGLCHRGHPSVPQPGDEASPRSRPRACAAQLQIRGARENSPERHEPGGD